MYNYKDAKMLDTMKVFDTKGQIQYVINVQGIPPIVTKPYEKEPKRLYHYCSLQSFINIINTRAMWLTSIFNMKDKNEAKWFYSILDNQIEKMHLKKELKQIALALREVVKINIDEAYSASFTTLRDKSSKWEIYGDKQQGVCFCINPQILPITRDLPIRQPQGQMLLTSTSFLQVNYDTNKHKKIIKDLVSLAITNKKEAYNIANHLAKLAYTCKKPTYSDEKEWRILYTPINVPPFEEKRLDYGKFDISNLKLNDKKIYYEFSILDGFITEIILGSKCPAEEKYISNILNNTGLCKSTCIPIIRSQYIE